MSFIRILILILLMVCGEQFNAEGHIQHWRGLYSEQLLQKIRGLDDIYNGKERRAQHWLEKNDPKLAEHLNIYMVAAFDYMTNLNDENTRKYSAASATLTEWLNEKNEIVEELCQDAEHFENQTVTRMLQKWLADNEVVKDQWLNEEITNLQNDIETIYGTAESEKDGVIYRLEPEFTDLMASSRDYDELLWGWLTWRNITGPHIKPLFTQIVTKMNQASRDNGYADLGEELRIRDYAVDNVECLVDELFEELLPFYEQIHAYVRKKLVNFYGADKVDPSGPLPAHLLGDMWGQDWSNIFDLITPFPDVSSYDVTDELVAQEYTPLKMFQLAEEFFTSLGLEPMTDTFWQESVMERPDDRPVECHPVAGDFMAEDDFRILMCAEVNMNYLLIIHHEMGHVEYYMQYKDQPTVFRTGANAAFHEAIGDTIALSVASPRHLETIGLLQPGLTKRSDDEFGNCFETEVECTDDEKRLINFLMQTVLRKIAFLPYGYLLDKWRWDVYRGTFNENHYNSEYWKARRKYQGVSPPVVRNEDDFDPGAKYHVAGFIPYVGYFLSCVGEFQFHEALCEAQGHKGHLYDCDIYQSLEAGDLLKSALKLGSSKPWPEVMEILTGQPDFKSDAIYNYFKPLYHWLQKENSGDWIGW